MRGLQSPLAVGLVRAHLPFSAAFGLAIALALPGVANAGADDFCGNGMVDVGELCDDGNTVNADGCSFPSCLR